MRVLHVLTHPGVDRGGAMQAMLLARGLRERGHDVRVVCNSSPKRELHPSFARWTDAGIDVVSFDMARPTELFRFRRMVSEWRPDVLHVHRNTALVFAYMATRIGRPIPSVFQRGTTRPPQTGLVKRLLQSPRTHRIVGVAHAVKDALVRHGIEGGKIEVVYGSYDEERFDPEKTLGKEIRSELGLPPEARIVIQVGKLNKRKTPEDFVRMAALVREKHPDAVFLLVGGGGRRSPEVKELRRKLGLEEHLLLLGFRDDIAELYAAADVVVNCSKHDEGLTGALREGAAMAKPLVATAISGNPELVRSGETGYLAAPRNVEELAAGVCRLLDDPAEARRLGEAARALVQREMREEGRLERMEAIYRNVIAEVRGVAVAKNGA